jgi:anthranilate synthase component 1
VPAFGLPSFYGGAVGYLAYEAAQFFERIPVNNSDPLELPLGIFMVARDLFIFDHVKHAIQVVSNVQAKGNLADAYHAACRRVKAMAERLNTVVPKTQPASARSRTLRFASNTTRSAFLDKVKKAKAYIRAGDIIQIQISQRLRAKSGLDPFLAYRALRVVNPSPYMFFLNFPKSRLIGSSPEMLIRCAEGKVETRPIAGTVLRGEDTQQDRAQEKRLLADPKERAEHIMLVDLARHELGRVCKPGTVKVPELMVIERYSHVMHIVSQVEGALAPGKDHFDALRSAFPAGTVTGAPKIRAMEIIDELEHEQRGPYAGAVGHIDFAGNLDLAITIRTMVHRAGEYYLQAAAGVVADSKPEKEYQETLNKMQALRKALELAHAGWVK